MSYLKTWEKGENTNSQLFFFSHNVFFSVKELHSTFISTDCSPVVGLNLEESVTYIGKECPSWHLMYISSCMD